MTSFRAAQIKSEMLAQKAIDEICEILLQEGGIAEILRFLAIMTHGRVLPAPVIVRLRQRAEKIAREQEGRVA
jgi:hypothetical protein